MNSFSPDLVAVAERYQRARMEANAASWVFDAEHPSVEIAPGLPGKGPRHAYSVEEIESTWGQFKYMAPSDRRDAMERGFHLRMQEFRAKLAAYDLAYEECGCAAADGRLALAALQYELATSDVLSRAA